jgi:Beta-propeller repeat
MFRGYRKSNSVRQRGEQRIRSRSYQPRVELLESRELLSGSSATGPLLQAYSQSALSFEPNQGQTDAQVRFLSRGPGYGLFLTDTGAVFELHNAVGGGPRSGPGGEESVFSLDLIGAQASPQIVGLDPLPGKSNYLMGNDPSQWQRNVANYGKVEYRGVYPGVDLIYYGNQGQLEYDFVVAPGGNPQAIRLGFEGTEQLAIDAAGDLVVHLPGGNIVNHAPVVYQDSAGGRQAIAGRYVLEGNNQVGFEVGARDASRPLIIDPVVAYATLYGGVYSDEALANVVDNAGDLYVAGWAVSPGIATVGNPYQPINKSSTTSGDAFILKLDPNGNPIATTYLNGTRGMTLCETAAFAIDVDNQNNVYVAGETDCTNLPTNAGQRAYGGGPYDGWFAKLTSDLSTLVYLSYTGGAGSDAVEKIKVDPNGDAFMDGYSSSLIAATPGAVTSTALNKEFVEKVDPNGNKLYYATLPGGKLWDFYDEYSGLAIDQNGDAIVASQTSSSAFPTTPGAFQRTLLGPTDACVAVLNPRGGLIAATYFGNNAWASGLTTDAAGNIYVTGTNNSGIFVAEFTADLKTLLFSLSLGSGVGTGIAVSPSGFIWVTGYTSSSTFPVTADAYQKTYGGGNDDALLVEIDTTQPAATSVVYSSFIGGSGDDFGMDIAVDSTGNVYVAGFTTSNNFPTTAGAYQTTDHGFSDYFAVQLVVPSLPLTFFVIAAPSFVTTGSTFSFTVSARDSSGNIDTTYTGMVDFTSSDPAAILPAAYAFTAADHGVHTFTMILPAGTPFTPGWQLLEVFDTANPGILGLAALFAL